MLTSMDDMNVNMDRCMVFHPWNRSAAVISAQLTQGYEEEVSYCQDKAKHILLQESIKNANVRMHEYYLSVLGKGLVGWSIRSLLTAVEQQDHVINVHYDK